MRQVCWQPVWHEERRGLGLEHLRLSGRCAESTLLAFDDRGRPFKLDYRLTWDERWRLGDADLRVVAGASERWLRLRTDGRGRWRHADGRAIPSLDGCVDIDIWPTPFTNSFPLRRERFKVGERRLFRMAWISAPDLSFKAQPQAYTRLPGDRYLFESLDGSGFKVRLPVDRDRLVIDYPGLFKRVVGA